MEDIKTYITEAKNYSLFDKEDADKIANILSQKGLLYLVNAFIAFIEDKNYKKAGWEDKELQKLLPKLKSLKQKPF